MNKTKTITLAACLLSACFFSTLSAQESQTESVPVPATSPGYPSGQTRLMIDNRDPQSNETFGTRDLAQSSGDTVSGETQQADSAADSAFADDSAETDNDGQQKYRVVLQLNDRSMGSLTTTGFAKARVPRDQVGHVVGLKIISPTSFLSDAAVVEAETQNDNGVMRVRLTDEMIQHLQFQPLEIKVYESNYANILLMAQPGALSRQPPPPEVDYPETPRMFFRLPGDHGINAHIADRETLKINSVIGSIDVPLNQIQAANFNFDGEGSVFLVMKDGSRLSGVCEVESIRITSKWGEHDLNVRDLQMMTPDRETRLEVLMNDGNILYRTVQGTNDVETRFRN